ncbi:MAG: YafY family transcriptional regulator [Streptomycetaceae bacterium]|nr:YafY family transcriptional regulator [Streptomycetaceae bacterium]
MRASRLLSVLLTLQTRGRVTAQELADELEVSVRTVYRDIESLGAAGIPVYAERGPTGGYRLLDGFRTRLNGLTADEADSLLFAGQPGPAAELGLGAVVASAQLKLMAGLAPELRERAERTAERFHLDTVGWYREADRSPHLAEVANAVWRRHRIRVRYRRWGGSVSERVLEPYGLVLKAGAWYLVAKPVDGDAHRTYRVGRIDELDVVEEEFEREAGFSLPEYWAGWAERFEDELYRVPAVVRLSPRARLAVAALFGPYRENAVAETASTPDADGWVRAVLPLESLRYGAHELLQLGAEAEVLGPPELRRALAAQARAVAVMYEDDEAAGRDEADAADEADIAGEAGEASDSRA